MIMAHLKNFTFQHINRLGKSMITPFHMPRPDFGKVVFLYFQFLRKKVAADIKGKFIPLDSSFELST